MVDPETTAVHGGPTPDPGTDALVPPLVTSTTYAQSAPDGPAPFTYSRSSNPTVAALEARLSRLAGGIGAVAFGSGMAAIDALVRVAAEPGQRVVVSDVVYGGTDRLLREEHAPTGIEVSRVDTSEPSNLDGHLDDAALVLLETPANPTLDLADVSGVIEAAHAAGVPVAVDNTFLTPLGQDVFALGADVSVHSTTKYIEGHGSAVGGAVLVREDPDLFTGLQHARKTTGSIAGPFQAWLTLRGLETLPLRLERVSSTAGTLAERLAAHPAVAHVRYPGHPDDPQCALARAQHERHGGLLAFELAGGRPAVDRFLGGLDVITLAEHLGTSRTLVTHPATMTHESVPVERREALGITEGLLRLSVGLEAPEDLLTDLDAALAAARREVPSDA